ncbi:hypothetical protein [Colwellia sp. MEBiC06753]
MKGKLLGLLLFIVSASSLANTEQQKLVGSWKLLSGEYIDHRGQVINYQQQQLQSIKVFSTSHFSFTSMKGDKFWASGTGTYQLHNNQYVETLKLNSFNEQEGTSFRFTAEFIDDRWYNSRWQDGKRVEYEVWQKID